MPRTLIHQTNIYQVRAGYDWGQFIVNEAKDTEGKTNNEVTIAITSSYGNFCYTWFSPPTSALEWIQGSLAKDWQYMASKMCVAPFTESDWEGTCIAVKRHILKLRLDRECTADEARDAYPDNNWENILDFSYWDEHLNVRANPNLPLVEDLHEMIVDKPTRQVRDFMAMHANLWPKLCEQIKGRIT